MFPEEPTSTINLLVTNLVLREMMILHKKERVKEREIEKRRESEESGYIRQLDILYSVYNIVNGSKPAQQIPRRIFIGFVSGVTHKYS